MTISATTQIVITPKKNSTSIVIISTQLAFRYELCVVIDMTIDRSELYKESNKAAIEYAKNAIQFAFLLNGASATALFTKAGTVFMSPAILLALGACCAVLCMGMSYFVQLLLCITWEKEKEPYIFFFLGKWRKTTLAQIECLRTFAIMLWLLSMTLFLCGVFVAAIYIR